MTGRAVAKRYARALLALAKEDGNPAQQAEALERAAVAFSVSEVAAVVHSPVVGSDARMAVVRRVVEALQLPRLVANCLYLLTERRRLDIVEEVSKAYVDLLDETLGRRRVLVRSAATLGDTQMQEVLKALGPIVGKAELVPVLETDAELLGGVVVEVGGVVYDGSVRTQVDRLARRMAAAREVSG